MAELTANIDAAQILAGEVAAKLQTAVHHKVSGLVTLCLRTVFDEPYTFDIQFERKRGRTEARLIFVRDGQEVDPMTASGGGVVDVAAFGLRLACLSLGSSRRTLVLDEPFKFVSENYRERLGLLVTDLAEKLGLQFIIVTHIPELVLGEVVEV